jgi:hypothetical protein
MTYFKAMPHPTQYFRLETRKVAFALLLIMGSVKMSFLFSQYDPICVAILKFKSRFIVELHPRKFTSSKMMKMM